MHHANGQAKRYIRTVLNLIRVESHNKDVVWSDSIVKIQQKTTQSSAMNLLIGTDATTPVIRALIRDVAVDIAGPDCYARRELSRNRATTLLNRNQDKQYAQVNRHRHPPRVFAVGDLVFIIKFSQSTGKLDSGMRGPYRVTRALPSDRYELKLLTGARGETTQAAAQYMLPWKGWCPESCAEFFGGKLLLRDLLKAFN